MSEDRSIRAFSGEDWREAGGILDRIADVRDQAEREARERREKNNRAMNALIRGEGVGQAEGRQGA